MPITQKNFNEEILRIIELLISTMKEAGYHYSPDMESNKDHAHVRIARELRDMENDMKKLKNLLVSSP